MPLLQTMPESIRRRIAESGATVRLGYPRWLRFLLQRDVIGITLGRSVFIAEAIEHDRAGLERLLRHELVHVEQIARLGFVTFYVRYIGEYLRWRCAGIGSSQAYRRISFEVEAYAAEAEPPIGEKNGGAV